MTQLDPVGTSVGRWRVGSETNLLGQSTRQTIPGKNMSFALAPGLFGGKAPAAGLYVRVGYFDEGHGSWELHYASTAAGGGAMKLAAHVSKQDTQEFIEIRLKLTDDFDLELAHGGAAHFALVDSDAAVGAPGLGRDGGWASSDPDVFACVTIAIAATLQWRCLSCCCMSCTYVLTDRMLHLWCTGGSRCWSAHLLTRWPRSSTK